MAFVGGGTWWSYSRRSLLSLREGAACGPREVKMVAQDVLPRSATVRPERRGPTTPTPTYTEYDERILNKFFMDRFQRALEEEMQADRNPAVTFEEITDLASRLHDLHRSDPFLVRLRVENVFHRIFGSMLPSAFRAVFARPVPVQSAQMAAFATSIGSQWLMGPNKLEPFGTTVEIERCRFLEQAGCVSICINGCKKPTESFIKNGLGIDLHIEPDYDDFSCKFHFGVSPPPDDQDPSLAEPCFLQCPTATRRMKLVGFEEGAKCENSPRWPLSGSSSSST